MKKSKAEIYSDDERNKHCKVGSGKIKTSNTANILFDKKFNLNKHFAYAFFLLFCFALSLISTTVKGNETPRPTGLTINFLLYPDRVFRDGYPANTELSQAVNYRENFKFTEIKQKQPLFGWKLQSEKRNTLQTAYRIIVASSYEKIKNDVGDKWDSGKIESKQSINIRYSGKPLNPDSVYFWKVKTWDNHGVESSFSAIRQFKTASTLTDYYGYDYYGTTRYPLEKQDVPPELIESLSDTHTFVDFGKARFGQLRVKLFGESKSDTVTLHLGEAVKDGRINRNPGGNIRYEALKVPLKPGWNTYDIIIPPHKYSRQDRIIRMPEYIGEVMPFRYLEIADYPGELLEKNMIHQVSVHYPFKDDASYFKSSDKVLNDVWDLCKHTIKATSFLGIYVDGNRERFPREADSYITQLSHYGVERGFSLARYTHEFQIKYSSQWTEWLLHVVLAAWADYMETGDPSSLEHFYPDLKAKSLTSLAREDGLISTKTGMVTPEIINSVHWHENEWRGREPDQAKFRDIVDWPQPGGFGGVKGETDGFEFRPINTVVNAFHYRALVLMEKIASALDKTRDAEFFHERAALVKASFNKKLLDRSTGIYVDGEGSSHSSIHANMFPLAFGMVPEENIDKVVKFIKSRGMACSPYGAQYLLKALFRTGEEDYALKLLTSTEERSWGHMIYDVGSTMTLEAWDKKYKPNLDWNHAWGSAPGNIIPRKLMGIEPLEPGYRKIRIKPQPASLKRAEIKHTTIRGEVNVSFKNKPGQLFVLNVDIPANMVADVYLPSYSSKQKVTMNNEPVPFEVRGSFVVVENVGSGDITFEVSL